MKALGVFLIFFCFCSSSLSKAMSPRTITEVSLVIRFFMRSEKFYSSLFGFDRIHFGSTDREGPILSLFDHDALSQIGTRHYLTTNGVGVTLYEQIKLSEPKGVSELGLNHLAFQTNDIEGFKQRVLKAGGRVVSPPTDWFPGDQSRKYKSAFIFDPDGIIIEVISHDYSALVSGIETPEKSPNPNANGHPGSLSHIGLTVHDIEEAIGFYCNSFGAIVLKGPETIKLKEKSGKSQVYKGLLKDFQEIKVAHLLTGNIGIELIQILDVFPETNGLPLEPNPQVKEASASSESNVSMAEYKNTLSRLGVLSFGFRETEKGIQMAIDRARENGGSILQGLKQKTEERLTEFAYIQDPDGSLVEVVSGSYVETWKPAY